ncbi:hypothetical protein H5119_05365 [Pseudoalteromonas sp. SG45-5]|uniref:hypothetical protein n=1 Tax=unclassified Pseudoalteromonas TaxID=194690 RepID=UPI0015FD990D|nr:MULTISPECIES: hypothetical protein [unclassified Pseudoalteromonas]MBB1384978.1 hypothetical protein [Pseudoalteromonas sp. SG45-5]MBB1392975.1 hypothetical protein [Pseudoalteromonas sp. SG44-4]MBB1448374.1 hypothetical protein [Pseudoalteromonas sp. SG41-6]
MFKKTLLALALTGVAGVANAGELTVAGGSKNISIEGNATTAAAGKLQAADFGDVTLDVGSDYIVNDLVVVTVSGATFDKTVTPTAVPTAGTATFSFVDFSSDNTVRFRVSTANHLAANDITIAGFQLLSGSPANKQKVQFSSNAISVNPLIGNYDAAKAVDLGMFVNQVAYTVTKLDGVVATGKGRAEFTTGLTDVLTLAATNDSAAIDGITLTKETHVIKGNFSYLADYDLAANGGDADGVVEAAELANAFTTTGFGAAKLSVDKGLSTLTITDATLPAASSTVTFNVIGATKKGSVITAPQSFTVESSVADATTTIPFSAVSAGSWTLDGSTDDIELMPFGSEYSQSITVANRGTVEGVITVTLKADGKTYVKELTQVASANSVTNISLEVAAFAAESGVTGNAHINVVVNAPAANIGVKGVYYHKKSADRVLTH